MVTPNATTATRTAGGERTATGMIQEVQTNQCVAAEGGACGAEPCEVSESPTWYLNHVRYLGAHRDQRRSHRGGRTDGA